MAKRTKKNDADQKNKKGFDSSKTDLAQNVMEPCIIVPQALGNEMFTAKDIWNQEVG